METSLFPDNVLDDTLDDDTPDDDNDINDNNDDDNGNNYDNDSDGLTIMIFQTIHFLFTHVCVHR